MASIAPFTRVSDVEVILTVVKPRPIIGFGNMVILDKLQASASAPDKTQKATGLLMSKKDTVSGATYREYVNLDAVAIDYAEETGVNKKATSYFAQPNHSDRVAVLSYVDGKLQDALKAFWYNNWTFAVFSNTAIDEDAILASNIFEVNKDHFLVLQTDDVSSFEKQIGQDYTIGVKHDLSEAMDSALVGAVATKTVGSVTWKFKKLVGITPENLTTNEVAGIKTAHAIAYIEARDQPETSEGTTLSGEYIDNLHGDIWIKYNIESKLQETLQNTDKVSYDQQGINLLSAQVNQVLEQAFQQGIILKNDETGKGEYSVTTTPRSAQSQKDLSDRHYGGLSFSYHRSGAIHDVTVQGTVQSDTMTE